MTKKLNSEDYSLPLEKSLSEQIYNALQGNIVEQIAKIAKVQNPINDYRSILEGHSFKVEEGTLPHYYNMFHEIKEKLCFEGDIDFYITGDSSVNAFSICSMNPEEPNIINVNSSLIDLMTDNELRFVVGHEMGHLINGNTKLTRLINFVYPGDAEAPVTLQYKIRLWGQLNELIADRYGFLAMPDINVCISAFFKMASGLDFEKMKVNIDKFIEENRKRLDFFRNDKGLNFDVHPVNPIRVEALYDFSKSVFFKKGGSSREKLQEEMDDLISILLRVRNSELDSHMADFIASAGLMMATSDEGATNEEIEVILEELSATKIFPMDFLEKVSKMDPNKISKMFSDSVNKIMEINPNLREAMFLYLISIVMADKEINSDEINFLLNIGEQALGYSQMEAANILLAVIQRHYTPKMTDLY
ncbi:MAG: M48 family metallopeptidase [Bacteroidales bacterium]|nr:M48 family metallopeptidase [Bacteroidales bacterium]